MIQREQKGETTGAVQKNKVGYFSMPYPFLHDQHMGLKPIDKLVLQVLGSATWDTQKEKKYKKLPYREIADLSGVHLAQLCSTGTNPDRPVKKVRTGIIARLEQGGWIRTMHVQDIPGQGHKNLYVWVDVDKIWAHIPQKGVHTKPKKQDHFVHTSSTDVNNLLFFPQAQSVNDTVHNVNDTVHTASTKETDIVHTASTNVGGNTSLILQSNTSPNTSTPSLGETMICTIRGVGGKILKKKSSAYEDDKKEIAAQLLPIAEDTTSKEAAIVRTEVPPTTPTEQVASDYKKLEPLVIRTVGDIPASWTVEQMEQWFARQPGAAVAKVYHNEKNWPQIVQMHQESSMTPKETILTYGYMKYFDPHWTQPGKTVTLITTSLFYANKNTERTKVPESEIFAKLGITGCSTAFGENDPKSPENQSRNERNKQRLRDILATKDRSEKEKHAHATH